MTADTTFDAIVIGSGLSGGWAAKELCEKGLRTLVLERGRNVVHGRDYPTANLAPWELPHRGSLPREVLAANPIVSRADGYGEDTAHFFVEDAEHPYVQERPFAWIRGYQVGGRSLVWDRACQRWSPGDFTAPERHGYGMRWPIGYDDVAPWFSHVERFIGVCGHRDGLEAMPDGEFLPPFDFNCVERHLRERIRAHYGDRHLVQGRFAHLTQPQPIHLEQGRGTCVARNLCQRGCPHGAYFSANASTLPWAARTGNLTIRPHSVVHSILVDERTGRARGVLVIDAERRVEIEYRARIVFVNASALNTNLVLLNSTSRRFPHGLGNDSGLLGRYVAVHNRRASARGTMPGFEDRYYYGRNPTDCMLANFRNLGERTMDFVGGYTTFTGAYRARGAPTAARVGGAYKDALARPGPWAIYMSMHGETIPREGNHVRLHDRRRDRWGIPLLVTSVAYDENDERMIADWRREAQAMLEVAGCRDVETRDDRQPPGLAMHEMGGCRMGHDPRTSLLNAWNQMHACPNVFVTDSACMTSTGNQSPALLTMALTARAANHAAAELGRRNL